MKNISILLLSTIFLSCGKKSLEVNMPNFAFVYSDYKNWYSLAYAGSDTLYLADRINNKNYFTIMSEEKKIELSKIVNPISKPEYITNSGKIKNRKFDFKFVFIMDKPVPKKVRFHKNANVENYQAAVKIVEIKSKLRFLKAEKEFSFEADSIRQATAANSDLKQ